MVPPLAGVAALAQATPVTPPLPEIGATTFTIPVAIMVNGVNTNDGLESGPETAAIDNNNASVITGWMGSMPSSGGTVIIPPGTWYTNEVLLFNDPHENLNVQGTMVAASKSNYSSYDYPFIYWIYANNDQISGSGGGSQGQLYGQGETWWPGSNGPDMVSFYDANTVEVSNITVTNAPHEHFSFEGSNNNVTFNGVTINSPSTSPQTDGIDPSGNNFLITNCNISTGDDDIAIKAGNATSNITITNMTIGTGHGISIGSNTEGGVNNVFVNNISFTNTAFGFRMKTNADNGGIVQNVSYNNVTMSNVPYPVFISSWYNGSGFAYGNVANGTFGSTALTFNSVTNGPYTGGVTPVWQNISFNNVTSSWTSTTATGYTHSIAGLLYGLPSSSIQGVNFNNVQISAYQGMSLAYAGTGAAPGEPGGVAVPISFTGNWAINTGTGQQFGTVTNPDNVNVSSSDTAGQNPGSVVYFNGELPAAYDGPAISPSYTPNYNTWETSNIVDLTLSSVPEPTTVALAVAASALMLMCRRRNTAKPGE
jgi:polygalacturonase